LCWDGQPLAEDRRLQPSYVVRRRRIGKVLDPRAILVGVIAGLGFVAALYLIGVLLGWPWHL
jgi:hypothetical protein